MTRTMRLWSQTTIPCVVLCMVLMMTHVVMGSDAQAHVRQTEVKIVSGVPQHEIPGAGAEWPSGNTYYGYRPPCDITAKSAVCVADGRRVVLPDAVSAGTIGLYTFNERLGNRVLDRSGNHNHGILGPRGKKRSFEAGPDRAGGAGASMAVNGVTYLHVRSSNTTDELSEDFTATFWVHLAADSEVSATNGGCTIFSISGNKLSVLPSRQLSLELKSRPTVTAQSSLRAGAWTHVALSYSSAKHTFSLYVNGIPDLSLPTSFETAMGVNVYIGGAPHTQCTAFSAFIDDVKLTRKALPQSEIAAEAFGTLGGAEYSFARIGCSRAAPCSWEQARVSCPAGYHICAQRELATGGYQIARSLGWVTWNDAIWTSEDASLVHNAAARKVALCCAFQ